MTAELICVGTELLLGNIVNTNAAYLAEKCAGLGLSCYYQSVVGDNEQRLEQTLRMAVGRSDVVILSGGLGPTEDDLTKEVASAVMGRKLMEDVAVRKHIERYFASRGVTPTDNNWKQALIPEGAVVLPNPNGTAPGVIIAGDKTHVILLPGPPHELKPMFEEHVIPYLKKLEPGIITSQTVKACGIGESKVETLLKDMIDSQTNPTLATYAKPGEVHIRVTARAEGEKEARRLIKPVIKEIKSRMGSHIYTTDEEVTLERAVVELLLANKLTVTCAESCTGGLLSARLINVPGASDVYKSGYVTYSNKAKRKILGVKKGTLEKYGAVSRQTAEEMAKGLAFVAKGDVAVSVTGLAGPDGGTEDKPVGLVYIACCVKGEVTTREYHFSGNRQTIREAAVSAALALMRGCMLEYFSKVTFGEKK
ncbi:MAG: competence/damage-inducible protein A [bacterium]|nr:competence/damage-inducible protein A [bacterium]MCM1374939.1 competence/damage-inducible protein A [Muribaculum sp.]